MDFDPATWPQLNLLDAGFILLILAALFGAIGRGLAREMLHSVLLAAAIVAGWMYLREQPLPVTQPEIARLVVPILGFMLAIYAFLWAIMRGLAPLVLSEGPVGLRSRFWAGGLAIAKIATLMLGLNLWFAVHSPYGPPHRLQSLPLLLQDSKIVQMSDRLTERLYLNLAAQGYLTYQKSTPTEAPAENAAETNGNTPNQGAAEAPPATTTPSPTAL